MIITLFLENVNIFYKILFNNLLFLFIFDKYFLFVKKLDVTTVITIISKEPLLFQGNRLYYTKMAIMPTHYL